MPDDSRSLDNPYLQSPVNSTPEQLLTEEFKSHTKQFISKKLREIKRALEDGSVSRNDTSVYTGLSGLALAFVKCAQCGLVDDKGAWLELAYLLTRKLSTKKDRTLTLLCGSSGHCLAEAVARSAVGKDPSQIVQKIKDDAKLLISNQSKGHNPSPDEYLYGRVGLLGTLAVLQRHFPGTGEPQLEDDICRLIISSGRAGRTKYKLKDGLLYYEWHGQVYIGAAHGYCGILYYLLEHVHCPSVQEALESDIKPSVDWLLSVRYPSGNLPSSAGSETDKLVHWCHGAPGAVYTFISAYKVYKEEKYKSAALACGECVWRRGFLKKGYGICHGTAGNAYTFLALYRLTQDIMHLNRAVYFARLCIADDINHPPADRPYSLFEGSAGTLYFLADLMDYQNARFPCFEI